MRRIIIIAGLVAVWWACIKVGQGFVSNTFEAGVLVAVIADMIYGFLKGVVSEITGEDL